jgi:hypothetical protein
MVLPDQDKKRSVRASLRVRVGSAINEEEHRRNNPKDRHEEIAIGDPQTEQWQDSRPAPVRKRRLLHPRLGQESWYFAGPCSMPVARVSWPAVTGEPADRNAARQ